MSCIGALKMNVKIQEFIEKAGLKEPLYPGKRLIQVCAVGPFKSHSIVYDWRNPAQLRIEIKAGTNGHNLPLKELQKYPVSFQAATFVVIEIDHEDEEEGKAGSGSRAPKAQKSMTGFMKVAQGKIPSVGKIVEMVVMGKEVAKEAFGKVFETLTSQITKLALSPTDLLAKAGNLVTKYTPPAFMEAKGDEQASYQYDREKIEPMFGITS
jgi:hypothetical protein